MNQYSEKFANSEECNEVLKIILENIPGYVSIVDVKTLTYKFANKTYEKSFDIPLKNIIGKPIKETIGEEASKFVLTCIEEIKKGTPVSYTKEFKLKQGKRWIKSIHTPIFNKEGELEKDIILAYDLTEEKQKEEELNLMSNQLQQTIEDLKKFNKMAVNRELAMIELKKKIKQLENQSNLEH